MKVENQVPIFLKPDDFQQKHTTQKFIEAKV